MCASYLANHPCENADKSPIFKQQNIPSTNDLDDNSFTLSKMISEIHKLNLRIWKRQLLKSQQLILEQMDQINPQLEFEEEYQLLYA